MRKLIEFRNIVKSFDGQVVLKGVNLNIYENEFVTLLGPSGCGKTTLLRILGGFLEQDEGTVIFDGKCIDNVPPYRREINTVFQRYALFPHPVRGSRPESAAAWFSRSRKGRAA